MALQPPSNLEALIEVAEKEQAKFDKRRHPLSIVGVSALLFGLATSLAYTLGAFWFSLPKPYWLPFMVAMFVLPIALFRTAWVMTRKHRRAIKELVTTQDPCVVPTLCRSIDIGSGQTVRGVVHTLTRLLPMVAPESLDATALHRLRWAVLWNSMAVEGGITDAEVAAFQIAVLDTLGRAGDTAALSQARELVSRKPTSPEEEQVVQAAQSCLNTLLALTHREQDARELLRPGTSVPADQLLRATQHRTASDAQEALRPSTAPVPVNCVTEMPQDNVQHLS